MARGRYTKENQPDGRGRPKGAENKVTKAAKDAFLTVMDLLEKRMTSDEDVIGRLSPSKAAELYVNLLNYIKPKLSKNDNNNQVSGDITINVKYDDKSKDIL